MMVVLFGWFTIVNMVCPLSNLDSFSVTKETSAETKRKAKAQGGDAFDSIERVVTLSTGMLEYFNIIYVS